MFGLDMNLVKLLVITILISHVGVKQGKMDEEYFEEAEFLAKKLFEKCGVSWD